MRTKGGEVRDVLLSSEIIRVGAERGNLRMFYDVTERNCTERQIHLTIQEVMTDTTWLSRRILEQLAQVKSGAGEPHDKVSHSRRKQQVLERLAMGASNNAIAHELGLATQTVCNYISNLYDKLGVHTRAEAVVWTRERSIVG